MHLDKTNDDDPEENVEVLSNIITHVAESIEKEIEQGNIGAVSTIDPKADGYWLVKWDGLPYRVAEDTVLRTGVTLKCNELVCKGTYLDKVGGTQ